MFAQKIEKFLHKTWLKVFYIKKWLKVFFYTKLIKICCTNVFAPKNFTDKQEIKLIKWNWFGRFVTGSVTV